jgi:hypothetical protein
LHRCVSSPLRPLVAFSEFGGDLAISSPSSCALPGPVSSTTSFFSSLRSEDRCGVHRLALLLLEPRCRPSRSTISIRRRWSHPVDSTRAFEQAPLRRCNVSSLLRTNHPARFSSEPFEIPGSSRLLSEAPKNLFALSKPPWFLVDSSPTPLAPSQIPKVLLRFISRQLEAHIGLVSFPPFHGVDFPTTFQDARSDLHRAYLTRLCCAFRFSQPRDALFHSRPHGLVSCRIRPWDSSFQRVPPSQSRHSFHYALPSASSSPSSTLLLLRSEERCSRKTSVETASESLRRARLRRVR